MLNPHLSNVVNTKQPSYFPPYPRAVILLGIPNFHPKTRFKLGKKKNRWRLQPHRLCCNWWNTPENLTNWYQKWPIHFKPKPPESPRIQTFQGPSGELRLFLVASKRLQEVAPQLDARQVSLMFNAFVKVETALVGFRGKKNVCWVCCFAEPWRLGEDKGGKKNTDGDLWWCFFLKLMVS